MKKRSIFSILLMMWACLSSISLRAQIYVEDAPINKGPVSSIGQNESSPNVAGDISFQPSEQNYSPLGGGIFVLVAAGLGYAAAKTKKNKE